MSEYVDKYRKIVNELIRKSFPKLKKKKIIIVDFPYRNFTASVWDLSFVVFIFTDQKKVELYYPDSLKGLFAHELCHIERHLKRGFFDKMSFIISYIFNREVRVKEENETDKLTIKKGYAKELYAFESKFSKLFGKNYLKLKSEMGYMRPNEVKQYAIKIGKWQ